MPIIYGDERGDSTAGLQAVFDGQEAWDVVTDRVVGGVAGPAIIVGRRLRQTRPLRIWPSRNTSRSRLELRDCMVTLYVVDAAEPDLNVRDGINHLAPSSLTEHRFTAL